MKKIVAASALFAAGALGLGLAFSQMLSFGSATDDSAAIETTASVAPRLPAVGNNAAPPKTAPAAKHPVIAEMPVPAAVNGSGAAKTVSDATPGSGMLPALPTLPVPAMASAFPAVPTFALPPGSGPAAALDVPPLAAPPPSVPLKLPRAFRKAEVDGPYIAMTFDDGPNPETTPKLLKMLAARNIKATFFVLGQRVISAPDIVRAAAEAGHEIGNHSWSHPQMPKLSVDAADRQVEDTNAAIEAATGQKTVLLRPPYGAMSAPLQKHLEDKYGISIIYWSVDPVDWKMRDAQAIYDQIMQQVRPGAVILAHDIHPTTVAAMPQVLDALLAKGYKFVTVSELMRMDRPAPPKVAVATNPGQGERKKPAKPPAATASAGRLPAGNLPASGPARKNTTTASNTVPRTGAVSMGGPLPPVMVPGAVGN